MVENERIWPGDATRGEAEVLDEREVWANEVARVLLARVRFPKRESGRYVEKDAFRLEHGEGMSDGVVIVPITADDRIVLVRQFRHPVRMWTRELPRGGRSEKETPEEAASRELREEIGAELRSVHPLGRITTDSGQQTGYPYLLAARVDETRRPEPEDSEVIDRFFRYSFSELRAACQRGEIVDSFTLAAVLRLEPHFDGDRFAYDERLAPAAASSGATGA